MPEHPQYLMWKARYEAELAAEQERAARRGQREVSRMEWQEAWHRYGVHWREGLIRRGTAWPRWWDIRAWLRLLLGKDEAR